ncbi:hypothetical protein AX16_010206 [Volvariella volvacea WC 439]|nr:hypothetical protein AX16_010206 [Volvariella volvacea WC 439]
MTTTTTTITIPITTKVRCATAFDLEEKFHNCTLQEFFGTDESNLPEFTGPSDLLNDHSSKIALGNPLLPLHKRFKAIERSFEAPDPLRYRAAQYLIELLRVLGYERKDAWLTMPGTDETIMFVNREKYQKYRDGPYTEVKRVACIDIALCHDPSLTPPSHKSKESTLGLPSPNASINSKLVKTTLDPIPSHKLYKLLVLVNRLEEGAHIAPVVVTAFQRNNGWRRSVGVPELREEMFPCLMFDGHLPVFYKAVVNKEMERQVRVLMRRKERIRLEVSRYILPAPEDLAPVFERPWREGYDRFHPFMESRSRRLLALKCLEAFKRIVHSNL